ncbi:hypothetical protein GC087_01345 [Pantoea sp. JZ2]|uniref:DUF6453 family protein n=1 Tax=Pantoea sp. JZ2 TaxID=2654189 RepID=UPI002B47C532|nr:DUF6453 family protein [Pantoea sp. JZ2]WRH11355.1 hypothetical protein GC087_01345 [Pantoea sp. JZ2]
MFGLSVQPADGGKPILLTAGMRYASFLGGASLPANGSAVTMKPQPGNSKSLIVPRNLVRVYESGNPAGPVLACTTSLSYSGNTLSYRPKWITPGKNPPNASPAGYVDVFSVAYADRPTGGDFGILVSNGANFMKITDSSYLGFVTYRGVISVNGEWTIPSSVTALGNYIVFARWSNTDTPLYLDRDSNTIRTYTGFGSTAGSVQGGSVSNIQIVIVSCGFSPPLPASGFGIAIWNAAGQCVYSSALAPVMWSDAYYDFGSYENYDDTTGEVLSWVNPTGNVAQPMIPLCSLGIQRGDYSRNANNYSYRVCLESGFKMSGNAVSTARARSTGREVVLYQYPKAMQVACQLPCLDASHYF